jgi:pilus assembly protein Flp/PilA
MLCRIRGFFAAESAATSIEYAIMASGIAVAIVVAVQSLGSTVNSLFVSVTALF